jgi:hypothetical protein
MEVLALYLIILSIINELEVENEKPLNTQKKAGFRSPAFP